MERRATIQGCYVISQRLLLAFVLLRHFPSDASLNCLSTIQAIETIMKPFKKNYLALIVFASCATPVLSEDIQSNKTEPSKLEEMVITSSKIEVPIRQVGASVSVITEDEIELRGYNSLTDILRTQTSIGASNTGGAGKQTALRIRGEEGFRTLVLVDGVEISDPTGVQIGPNVEHLNAGSHISRVEILRGPQGFIYGADAGGVINILTKDSDEAIEGQANVEYGRFNTRTIDSYIAGSAANATYFLSVNTLDTDGFNSRSDDTSRDEDGYENDTVHAKLGYNFTDELSVKLINRIVDSETEYDDCFGANDCESEFGQKIARVDLNFNNSFTTQNIFYSKMELDRDFSSGGFSFGFDGETEKFGYQGSYNLSENITPMLKPKAA